MTGKETGKAVIFECDYQSYQCGIGMKCTCFFAFAASEPGSSRDVGSPSERNSEFDRFRE